MLVPWGLELRQGRGEEHINCCSPGLLITVSDSAIYVSALDYVIAELRSSHETVLASEQRSPPALQPVCGRHSHSRGASPLFADSVGAKAGLPKLASPYKVVDLGRHLIGGAILAHKGRQDLVVYETTSLVDRTLQAANFGGSPALVNCTAGLRWGSWEGDACKVLLRRLLPHPV